VIALVVIAVAAVVAAGGLLASNMGFKLNYPLTAQAVSVSKTGRQCLGLPYNRQVGIDTAQQLLTDTGAFSLEKFDPATDSNAPYPGTAFNLTSGEGYLVRVLSDSDYIAVGSHDPSLQIDFLAQSIGVSKTGRSRFAPPYHGVASNAQELLGEIGAFSIEKFDPATDSNAPYPGTPFNVEPGNCYLVRVLSDTSYIPAHY
jgi:hypothetical protein